MTVLQSYERLTAAGAVKKDAGQDVVLRKLDELARRLNEPKAKSGFFGQLFKSTPKPPRGLYIWGEVGRGKTMLMDLFFSELETPAKQRIHFHAFMQDVHAKRAQMRSQDIIADIANEIAGRADLLCLDEMQISDIADAMMIGRLFEALQEREVCFVTTSNLPPDDLYKDGLNRHLFVPFIEKLKSSLDIVEVGSGRDYRLGRIATRKTYLTPLGKNADLQMKTLWNDLTDNTYGSSCDLDVLGRILHVPRAARSCASFTFSELCQQPLAAPDYLALTRNFRIIFIHQIPVLKASDRNEAKRLVLMIDTFYDAGTRLVVSAAGAPDQLYKSGPHQAEFSRTISRLEEMQSASWWEKS